MLKKEQITSIEQLISELKNVDDEDECKKLVKLIDIPIEEYYPYAFFSNEQYTRNCIVRTKTYELLLLCWDKGQDTPIHCHNEQECWVYAVDGSFTERRYIESNGELEISNELHLTKSRISYMNDNMGFHSLTNSRENGRSMSLHLYMSPIDECRVFNKTQEEFELKELEYYSYRGKILEKEESYKTVAKG